MSITDTGTGIRAHRHEARGGRRTRGLLVSIAIAVLAAAGSTFGAGSAFADTPSARLTVESFALPTSFKTGGACDAASIGGLVETWGVDMSAAVDCDLYGVIVRNSGNRATDGTPITVSYAVPPGVTAQAVGFFWSALEQTGPNLHFLCPSFSECTFPIPLGPGQWLRMYVFVSVEGGAASPLHSSVAVSGGGAPEASASLQTPVGSQPQFGLSSVGTLMAGADGEPDTQAGEHPFEFTASVQLNSVWREDPEGIAAHTSVHDVKDVVVDLPVGMVGSALATPLCTYAQLSSPARCPADTVIGRIKTEPHVSAGVIGPLYNMTPERGTAAQFGFVDGQNGTHALSASVVPTPGGYVLRTTTSDIPQVPLTGLSVSIYGNPAVRQEEIAQAEEKTASKISPVALFTDPSGCSGEPLATSVHIDSWQSPGRFNTDGTPDFSDPRWLGATTSAPPVTGCNLLQFNPGLSVQPETSVAGSPTGLNVELRVPQSEDPLTLASPPLRDASIVLPAGVGLNPAAAGGLGSCSLAQIGLGSVALPACPDSSKVGSVELQTPLLPGTLGGSIYLAAQEENPFHALVAAYIVVADPVTGTVLKLPGELRLDPVTGQVTGVFDENPQFPFNDLRLHFFGGQRGVLTTPQACGSYTTGSVLSPWSAPDSGPAATPSDSFQVTSGCTGGFAPGFTAGSTVTQAGGFAPFTLTLTRTDQDQNLAGITLRMPPGLLGVLKSVALCGEPQASQGACGQESLVGHTTVAAGAGAHPFYLGGQVFLTGPYKGAPFGLSIVVPAIAGPFNLGNVVVRASIAVDPHTSALTVTSDPLPSILRGIPLDLRTVNVTVDRPAFTFNPTNCEPLAVNGTITSTQGTQTQVSSAFHASNCAALTFHPVFSASSLAKTSRQGGAALDVKVSYPQGTQANIHSVAVTLPKQLPARLSTIQQACPEAVFNANPASCDEGSVIGTGTASTPILAAPLTGPAYLVSHGGAAFPDIDVILQGQGITLDLVGHVNISKTGITSSTFGEVPDAPINSFELNLPEGPHSGLSAVGSLCTSPLSMPTTITGQNGALTQQTTKIKVTGCAPVKKKKHKAKKHKAKKRRGKKANHRRRG
jgi:hypothetical protein